MLNVLSLGAGVQSTTVYLMSCLGELPKLDCAIFADTGWEPQKVYDHLVWLETEIAPRYGIPIHRVSCGRSLRDDTRISQSRGRVGDEDGKRFASMPLLVLNHDGSRGMIKRQCTSEFKIQPIERKIKVLLGLGPRDRWPAEQAVRQWFGISADEFRRCTVPRRKDGKPCLWRSNVYPLCDQEFFHDGRTVALGVVPRSRAGCLQWCLSRGFPEPPRSACIACPFRSDREWAALKEVPAEWQDAIETDRAIRHCGGMEGEVYLHRHRIPLEQVQLDPKDDYPLFQCDDGVCGV